MTKVQEEILRWLAGSREFDAGIALFKQVSRNTFYIANLQKSRRQSTLVYELEKAVRVQGLKFKVQSLKSEQSQSQSQSQLQKSEVKGQRSEGKEKTPSVPINRDSSPLRTNAQRRQTGAANKPDASAKPKFVIRDEFPFLKRSDCPDVLKILVADMLTAHEKYVKAHEQLFEVAHKSEDVCFDTAEEVVSNYLTNRQIWDELEHYKKTGKLLGEHPVFEEQKKKEAAEKMTVDEMEKKIKNLDRQLKYRQKRLKNNRKNENVAERKAEMKALRGEIKSLKFKVQSLKKE